jgi:hypothetical protein
MSQNNIMFELTEEEISDITGGRILPMPILITFNRALFPKWM